MESVFFGLYFVDALKIFVALALGLTVGLASKLYSRACS